MAAGHLEKILVLNVYASGTGPIKPAMVIYTSQVGSRIVCSDAMQVLLRPLYNWECNVMEMRSSVVNSSTAMRGGRGVEGNEWHVEPG